MAEYNDSIMKPSIWLVEQQNWKFTVPIYQRLFTWGDEQFERLLDDLKAWDGNGPYYLGIITVVEKGGRLLLIDGQQRLTVIAILAGMLGWCDKKDPKDFLDYEARPADRAALKTIWDFGKSWINEDEAKFEHTLEAAGIASEAMKRFICHIVKKRDDWRGVNNKGLCQNLTLLMSKLPAAYGTNTNLQNEYFEKLNSSGKQLEPHEILKVRICKTTEDFAVWNRAEDFTKCFDDKTTNDNGALQKGVPILDILQADKKKDDTIEEENGIDKNTPVKMKIDGDTIIIYEEESGTEKNTPFTITMKDGESHLKTSVEKWRPSLIDFPMFLLHVLNIIVKDPSISADSHNLLKDFKDKLPDGEKSKFCTEMGRYRKFLDGWIIHREVNDVSDDNDSKYAFWDNKNEVVYIKGQGEDEQNDLLAIAKKIKQLQMILFALGGQKQKWLCDAYRWATEENNGKEIKSLQSQEDLKAWCKWLRDRLIKEADFKIDEEGEDWRDTYLTYGNARPVHFMCLDYFLWELANESREDCPEPLKSIFEGGILQAVKTFVPRANRSVEHFHPQTDDNSQNRGPFADQTCAVLGWGATIGNPPITIKNIFGNLALISAGRNSEYGNMSVAGKSERIDKLVKEGRLESIKLLLMKQACKGHDDKWLPCTAEEHANLMLKVIRWGLSREI